MHPHRTLALKCLIHYRLKRYRRRRPSRLIRL
jgi:hypothetical protein